MKGDLEYPAILGSRLTFHRNIYIEPMNIKTYTDNLSDKDKQTIFSIEPNTLLVFQKFGYRDYIFSVFVACIIARNKISELTIKKFIQKIEKKSAIPSNTKIKNALRKLCEKKYLHRNKDGTYSTCAQVHANIRNIKKFGMKFLNFYDSRFKISRWQIEYYKANSKDKSIKDFLFGELLARTYFEVPTTYTTIKKDLNLTRYEVNKISDLQSTEYHLNHYNKKDTAFFNVNLNYSCIGKRYHKNFYATKLKLSPYVKKISFIDQNILDRWGDVMNHKQKISFAKELVGIKNSGSLSDREIAARYPAFYSDQKREWFLPRLSEKLITNDIKRNTKTRKLIVRQDKDMLWWKDTNLSNYTHPYKFNAPLNSRFHIHK